MRPVLGLLTPVPSELATLCCANMCEHRGFTLRRSGFPSAAPPLPAVLDAAPADDEAEKQAYLSYLRQYK